MIVDIQRYVVANELSLEKDLLCVREASVFSL